MACWWVLRAYSRGVRIVQCEKRFATFASIPVLNCTRHWVCVDLSAGGPAGHQLPHSLMYLAGGGCLRCLACVYPISSSKWWKFIENSMPKREIFFGGGQSPPHPPSAPQGEALFRDTGSECYTLWDPDPEVE